MLSRRHFLVRVAALPVLGIAGFQPRRQTRTGFSPDEIRFHRAWTRYRRTARLGQPTWQEALDVLHALGYCRAT
jgi:hypothetical protein